MNKGIIASVMFLALVSVYAENADQIISASGVKGGLVVVVGADDAQMAAEFAGKPGFVVHLLDTDPKKVEKARDVLGKAGNYGKAAVDVFDAEKLPYVDNSVNLVVVAGGRWPVASEEIKRVLAPRGMAMFPKELRSQVSSLSPRSVGDRLVYNKPVPTDIDEWTHYLHDPGNNAVARDEVVGPPRRLQWVGGPEWTRNHHKLNSISSLVTAGGKIFFILDTATAADLSVPGKWVVIGRDAFNGVELWRKPMQSWVFHGRGFRSGPAQVTRLLVASDDSIYLPMGLNEPVSRLEADTGKVISTYKNTKGAEEIIFAQGKLIALTGDPIAEQAATHEKFRGVLKGPNTKSVSATDVKTGEELWKWQNPDANPLQETLASDGKAVFFQVNDSVVCLDLHTGKEKWTYGKPGKQKIQMKGFGKYVLVVSDGVVLFQLSGKLTALSAETGKKKWDMPGGQGFHAPLDLFVVNGVVWIGNHPSDSVAPLPKDDFSRPVDLQTGEPKGSNQVMADLQSVGHHHRCYRNKATSRYILQGKRGVEMQDLEGDDHSRNNWLRGTCQYGIMPANGLIYAPSHSCGCYMESKLWGFYALAPASTDTASGPRVSDDKRLQKGPAYKSAETSDKKDEKESWPMLRGNALRNGTASTTLKPELAKSWSADIGGRLTQPVTAGGKVIVAAIDRHTVYALSEKDGNVTWKKTVGGRVDSAPTIYNGQVLFGCADGRVYALRLSDGELAWSFLAARRDERTVAFNQVESVWPVRGSVLVLDGIVYCSAGRSTWLDDGIDLYGLEPVSGKMIYHHCYRSRHPVLGEGRDKARPEYNKANSQNRADYKTALQPDLSDSFSMAGGSIQDVLVSDGKNVFLHQAKFSPKLEKQDVLTRHFFSTSGLIDGNENHRSHWVMGSGDFSMVAVAYSWIVNGGRWGTVNATFGLMLAYDNNSLWVVKRNKGGYTLFEKENKPFSDDEKPSSDFSPKAAKRNKSEKKKDSKPAGANKWQTALSIRPRAIIKAGPHLFIGGMPAQKDPDDPYALYEGRMGGLLQAVSAADGSKASEIKLKAPVVWDGMAAANGKLFLSDTDGKVMCFSGR